MKPLSPRQREILGLVAQGYSNPAIAEQLGITLSTADTHVENILRKLRVHNRAHAVAVALRSGALEYRGTS